MELNCAWDNKFQQMTFKNYFNSRTLIIIFDLMMSNTIIVKWLHLAQNIKVSKFHYNSP